VINQVKQKLHLVGYLLRQYFIFFFFFKNPFFVIAIYGGLVENWGQNETEHSACL